MNRLYLNHKPSDSVEIGRVCGISNLEYGTHLSFNAEFEAVFGFGERFDVLNQIGLNRKNQVYETFTNQGADTYIPIPFCLTDAGFGLFIDTRHVIHISTKKLQGESQFFAELPRGSSDIHFFHGPPSTILDLYTSFTGRPALPPDWAFGTWISANRWNNQTLVEHQVSEAINNGMKPSVVVIEAWSDEATFYTFDAVRFPDPAGMIRRFNEMGVKCILWQIPVLKKLEEGHVNLEHENDCAYAVRHDYVVKNPDGSPYVIPDDRWFSGSMIPDFTNSKVCEWWFSKRQYLLDMGVAGFKTDGGEFIYDEKPIFHDGTTGTEMQNGYAYAYTEKYAQFAGNSRVLFSRAGYTGSQANSLHWAGDQRSTWEELRHILVAGLNAGLSGIPFWGFDIAGFAGNLPSVELYLRSYALACFSPIMQWHSEMLGGQFADLLPSDDISNDRSPWNIAARYNDPQVLDVCRYFSAERQRLLPYIIKEAEFCAQSGRPLIAPIFFDAYSDKHTFNIDDQYMLGRFLMVAPVLWENMTEREVYLPKGEWLDYWTKEKYYGCRTITVKCDISHIPVFKLSNGTYS